MVTMDASRRPDRGLCRDRLALLVHTVGELAGLVILALLTAGGGGWAQDTISFAGKTIKIVVGIPPGGGVDTQ